MKPPAEGEVVTFGHVRDPLTHQAPSECEALYP